MIAIHLHNKYVKGTEKEAIVQLVDGFLCNTTNVLTKFLPLPTSKVYISTRVIKHGYDKRPAREFDVLIENLGSIVKYPDYVYRSKSGKRGLYEFVKVIKNIKYMCSVEVIQATETVLARLEVATFFKVEDKYLKSHKLLWEWKGGKPSS